MKKRNKKLKDLKSKINQTINNLDKSKTPDNKKLINLLQEINSLSLEPVFEGEALFRTTLYSIGDAVITTDKKGNVRQMNLVAEKLCGWKETEAKDKPLEVVFNIINEITRKKCENPVKKVLKSKNVIGLANHTLLISKKGKEIPVTDSGAPIKNAKGEILGVVLVFRDQTEERKKQNALLESETRYKSLFDNSPDAIFLADPKTGKIIDANAAALKLIKKPLSKVVGMHQSHLHPQRLKSYSTKTFKTQIKETDLNIPVENFLVTATRNEIPIEVLASTITINGKKVIQGVFRNITARRRMEAALSGSQEMLKNVLEQFPGVVFWKDFNSVYLGCNQAFATAAGLKNSSEIIGKTDFDLPWAKTEAKSYRADDREVMDKNILKLNIVETQHQAKNKLQWFDTSKVPLKDNGGNVIGVLGISNDITERVKAEEALRESENKFRLLFEHSKDAMLLLDGKVFFDCNKAAMELMGCKSKEQMLSLHPAQLSPEFQPDGSSSAQNVDRIIKKTFKNGSSRFEWIHRKITGEDFPVEVMLTAIPLAGKQILFTVWRDRTEQKIIEFEIKKTKDRMQLLVEGTPHLFFYVKNLEGLVEYISPSIKNITGYKVDQWFNQKHWFITDSPINKKAKERTPVHLKGKVYSNPVYLEIFHANGSKLMLEIYERPIIIEGKVIGLQGVAHDITDRANFEQHLRDSENSYRGLFNSVSEAIYVLNENGIFIDINQGAVDMYGYRKDELIGKTPEFVSAPNKNDLPSVAIALGKAFNGERQQFEFWGKRKNGEAFLKDVRLYPGIYFDKKVTIALAQDITEKNRAEQLLRESEERYRLIANNTADTISILDMNLNYTYISPSVVNLLGYTPDELISIGLSKITNKDDYSNIINTFKQEIQNEKSGKKDPNRSRIIQFKQNKKDGSTIWVEGTVSFLRDNYGLPIGVLAVSRDIASRKLVEQALELSEERYRAISNLTSDYLFSTQADENGIHNVVWIAGSFEKITGYSFEEYKKIGGWRAILHPDELVLDDLDLEILRKNEKVIREIRTYHKDGSLVWVKSLAQPVWDNKNNKLLGVYGAVEDITERKKNEETLKMMAHMLDTAPNSITVHDDEGNFVYANRSAFKMHGYNQEEFKRLNIRDLDDIENAELVSKRMQMIEEMGEAIFEVQHFRKDKSKIPLEVFVKNVRWADKYAFLSIATDITERKRSEEMLRENEQRYHSFINSHTDLMFVKDESLRYIVANEATLKFFNKTREELLYKTDFELMNLDSAKNCKITDLKALHTKSVVISEELTSNQVFETTKFPLSLKNNKVGLGGIVRDITERKRAEVLQKIQYKIAEAAVASKHLNELFETVRIELSNIMNVHNFFIALYDEKTGLLKSDVDKDEVEVISEWPAKGSMTGYVIEQRRPVLLTKREINQLISTGQAGMIGVIPEIWLGVPFRVGGIVIGVLVVQDYNNPKTFDYTSLEILEIVAHELSIYIQHKRAEEETLKLSTAIVQSPIIVVITYPNGNIEYANPKFSEVTGYTIKEVAGLKTDILKSGYHSKEFYKNLWDTILSGKTWQGEFQNKKKNGEYYWENALISPIINDEGKITNFVAVKEDITEKKKMIAELIIAKENAEEMNRVKSSFFANMSHELRTPMVGILGFSEVLSNELKDNPEYFNMVNSINKSGQRLLETLNLILNLSKLEASKIEVNSKTQNIVPMLKESFNFFESAADKKGLSYSFESENIEVLCDIDQTLFASIFNNLLNNAIKFTDTGSVKLIINSDSKNATISVNDTGVGISEEKQTVIWDEFRQASEGYNRSFEGTGLGLTIAKRYTYLMKGTVSVKSKLNIGTTFIVTFPLTKHSENINNNFSVNTAPEINTSTEIKSVYKVLYIEDDEIASKYVTTITKGSYIIDIAQDSDEALLKVKQNRYDAILMDINLNRGMDGIELTAILRKMENYKTIPIIALTAFAMGKEKEEFLAKGMTHYLSKPFTKAQIISLLKSAIDKN